ncbi:MAG: ABC transporter substrate-binding protein, partial [Pseudomonadota bacterium]
MSDRDRTSRVSRRGVLAGLAASGAGATAIASPARAQASSVTWSFASAFGREREAISRPLSELLSRVSELTDGTLTLAPQGDAGAAAPSSQSAMADVLAGKIDAVCANAAAAMATSPVFALAGGAPFGLNARLHRAWLHETDGLGLLNAAFAPLNVVAIPVAATGAHMGGWFRKEIATADALKGVPIAIDGLGAAVFEAMGAR